MACELYVFDGHHTKFQLAEHFADKPLVFCQLLLKFRLTETLSVFPLEAERQNSLTTALLM